jgi:hypothetical protein
VDYAVAAVNLLNAATVVMMMMMMLDLLRGSRSRGSGNQMVNRLEE